MSRLFETLTNLNVENGIDYDECKDALSGAKRKLHALQEDLKVQCCFPPCELSDASFRVN
ncbi:MAG: hypothetical protein C4K49_00680 [Candidatus Thorarchaeota archaeon]|nr:MAG: hypothetical protein C4K49_00680 [Candidatus Thorarchaeota archaeon]